MANVKIMSLNTGGWNNVIKMRPIDNYLKSKNGKEYLLRRFFYGTIYHPSASGDLMGIVYSTGWKTHEPVLDEDGHYVIVYGLLDN